MNRNILKYSLAAVACGVMICGVDTFAEDSLEKGFAQPPLQARTRAYWWWLNGNVDKAAITKDLEWMKKIGMGGGLIFDAGGPAGRTPAGPLFGTPAWRELFKHAVVEADRLGLEISLSPQSGWNLGGPPVEPEQAAKHITWSESRIIGPGRYAGKLPAPPCLNNWYQDARVVAYRLKPSFIGAVARPEVVASSSALPRRPQAALDGQADTSWARKRRPPLSDEKPEWLQLTFAAPVTVSGLTILPVKGYGPKRGEWQVSEDGERFTTVARFAVTEKGPIPLHFTAVTSRHFRLLLQEAFAGGKFDPAVGVSELTLLDLAGQPLDFGKANSPVSRLESKAGYHEGSDWTIHDPKPFKPGEEDVLPQNVIDLTSHLDKDGMLRWEAPEGTWQVFRFGITVNGGHVSFSSGQQPGWTGYVVDYLDAESLTSYWRQVVDPLLGEIEPYLGKSFKGFETDSWEGGGMNWTTCMPEEFRKRRGYDAIPFLPVFAGRIVESREASNRFLYDWRKTVGDLMADNHYGVMAKLAADRGLLIHCEAGGPHAGPFDALKNWGRCTWPMGEFWVQSPHRSSEDARFFMKGPASAAHIYGKPIACGEGFTSVGPHWNDTLWSSQKPTFDHEVCAGVNLTFWHAFTCSPASMGVPGQEYFAGTHFNPQITWANQAHGFIGYLNRCQFMLQQGQFVADVCYYYGDHVPNVPGRKQTDPAKVLPGYDYDYLNEEMLLKMTVQDGRLVLPCGMSYRLLALPNLKIMSLDVLKKVSELVKAGAAVAGPQPEKNPSLSGGVAADGQFKSLCEELWGAGKVSTNATKTVLAGLGVPPDFEATEVIGTNKLDFIHRRDGEAEIYFLSNQAAEPVRFTGVFRVVGKQPELWDAVTGTRRDLPQFECKEGRTTLPLELDAYGSAFVVFRGRIQKSESRSQNAGKQWRAEPATPSAPDSGSQAHPSKGDGKTEQKVGTDRRAVRGLAESGGSGGPALPKNFPEFKPVYELSGPWSVQFDPKWGGATNAVTFETLTDWTSNTVEGIKYYSGTATYRKVFDLASVNGQQVAVSSDKTNGSPLTAHGLLYISLGEVREMAEVRLNGKNLGVVWCPPWRVDVTGLLKPTGNELEIDVVNNWPNRLIGDGKLPPNKRIAKTHYTGWGKPGADGKEQPLFPAGLLGPVRVMVAE